MDPISEQLQEDILTIIIFDDVKGQILRNMIPLELFEGINREIAERSYSFTTKYKKAPKEEIATLFDDVLNGKEKGKAKRLKSYLTALFESKDTVNTPYIMDRATSFIRQQELKIGVLEAAEILHSGAEDSVEQAASVITKHMKNRLDLFDPGTMLDNSDRFYGFLNRVDNSLPTGIPELDAIGLGPSPETLYMLIGAYGAGKSWFLINLGKRAVMTRHKVCHISLEMPEDQVVKRYIQALFAISKRSSDAFVPVLERDKNGEIVGIDFLTVHPKISLEDPKILDKLKKKMHRWAPRLKNRLIIKNFPMRTLTVNGLNAYLDNLEDQKGFTPDLLLLDYADIMKIGGSDKGDFRVNLGRTIEDIRGIAGERKMAVASVSQANREGGKAKIISGTMVAEDWSKMATADTVLTYNQTRAEQIRGLARLVVDKARDDRKGMQILITQNYHMGQFVLDSCYMPRNYLDMIPGEEE